MKGAVSQILHGFAWRGEEKSRRAPHLRTALNSNQYMLTVLLAAVPALVAAVYAGGARIFGMLLVTYVCIGAVEVLFSTFRNQQVDFGTVVSGLLLVLTLPADTPLWLVALGALFAMFFGKAIFGGTGHNVFNPAMLGRCFILLAYPKLISDSLDTLGGGLGVPLTLSFGDLGYAAALIPVILGGAVLLFTRVSAWRTVLATVGTGCGLSLVLWLVGAADYSILTLPFYAGFLFGAIFIATDPVSSPNTSVGQWIYGAVVGGLAVLITMLATYGEGMLFAILLGNLITPTIDSAVLNVRFRGYGL